MAEYTGARSAEGQAFARDLKRQPKEVQTIFRMLSQDLQGQFRDAWGQEKDVSFYKNAKNIVFANTQADGKDGVYLTEEGIASALGNANPPVCQTQGARESLR